jgi:RimJ/RimL family protein N-acetyltransferase
VEVVHYLTLDGIRLPPPTLPQTLSAEGVNLRIFGRQDAGLLAKASEDAEIVRWTFIPPDLDRAAADALTERWLARAAEGRLRPYVISAAPSRPAVGLVSLALQDPTDAWLADVFYWLLPEGRRLGLASRAVRLLLKWGFEEGGVPRVALYTKEGNVLSERVAERCGFTTRGPLNGIAAMRCSGSEGGCSTRPSRSSRKLSD